MSEKAISRNIPAEVRRELRKEVNFGCPAKNCGSPFLSYHHFDPPWHLKKHHNPVGMIALCLHHHKAADNGAYTNEQLQNLKVNPYLKNEDLLIGEISLKRENILFDIGGNYFLGASEIYVRNDEKFIWIDFDVEGNIMLNFDIKSNDGNLIFSMRNNDWIISTTLEDIESPPAMKKIKVRDNEKDIRLDIEFKALSLESFIREYQTIIGQRLMHNLLSVLPKKELVVCKVRGKLNYPFQMHFNDGRTNMKNLKGPFTINGIYNLAENATIECFDLVDFFTIGNGAIIK
ncbi:hypothetical protein V3Q77_03080 [Flavobacterium davisii]|uniref:HNH endonuclease n=1 Tax=Flavobacterium davisii TaxID=2906077 RepID=A0ABW8PM79_9FLAO